MKTIRKWGGPLVPISIKKKNRESRKWVLLFKNCHLDIPAIKND
jgi:hypothetical protein